MTLRISDLQSDSDLDSIRNSCDVFWLKTVFFRQEVHYNMVYIAYYTELNLQICNSAQKQRICRENSKYASDENLYGHFLPRRKAANFCHPASARFSCPNNK